MPLLGIITINIIKKEVRLLGMISSIITMYISLYIYLTYENNNIEFQFRDQIDLKYYQISLGLDGINLSLILLTTILIPILILLKETKKEEDENKIVKLLLTIESILLFLFSALDLFIFFINFELILIPIFLLIGIYGSKERRIEAAYRFLIYSLIGSLLTLVVLIILFIKYGTTQNEILAIKSSMESISLVKLFWIFLFFSFAIKIPVFPFHTWLPYVHVEAPTIGSILLAGIMLKLGVYGLIRYNIGIFSAIDNYFIPLVYLMGFLSVLYGAITTIRQIDLKKIIAYSSIVHMNFGTIGLFTNELEGILGSTYLIISHGFVSSGLFLLIGILYKRYHTRILYYYNGLIYTMPIYGTILIILTLGNISLPLTSSFISEILILISTIKVNIFIAILLSLTLIISTGYAIWLANRLLFGQSSKYITIYKDLTLNEFIALIPLILLTYILGINTNLLFNILSLNLTNLLY